VDELPIRDGTQDNPEDNRYNRVTMFAHDPAQQSEGKHQIRVEHRIAEGEGADGAEHSDGGDEDARGDGYDTGEVVSNDHSDTNKQNLLYELGGDQTIDHMHMLVKQARTGKKPL